jgi:MoaD family protein
MRVNLKILLPGLAEVIGRTELEIEFDGETVRDMIEFLITTYGRKARQALYDENGEFDLLIQVLINGEQWVTKDLFDTTLKDGDNVIILIMMAGG